MIINALAVTHSTPIGHLFSDEHKVNTFESSTSLQDVFLHFTEYASDVVIIVEEAILIGIITLKDMIKALKNCDNLLLPVKNFMSSPLQTFHSTMSIAEVLDGMMHAKFDKIVVTKTDEILWVMDRRHLLSICYNQLTPFIKHEYNMLN